jgi:putative spermidine/putrescine transport system permease protein
VFLLVTMPRIGFAIVISAALLVPTSVDELVIAAFVSGGGDATLTRIMVLVLRNRIDPTVASIATITTVMTALLLEMSQLVG